MKISLITVGRFHHFNLARQLHKHHVLNEIFSGFPKLKLRNETKIPKEKIKTFPYFQLPSMIFDRYLGKIFPQINDQLSNLSHRTLSLKASQRISESNILIASSRSGLEAGNKIKKYGGIFFCDRGSTHIEFQNEILKDEYKNLKLPYHPISNESIHRECEEYSLSDFISIPSTFVLNSFLKKGINKNKLFLNPYGVNLETFGPLPKIKSEDFTVIYVGQLSVRKGIFYLLEAFKKLKIKKKKLILIGSIDYQIKNKVEKYFSDEIKYMSIIKNDKLKKYYSSSDVMVQPSIEEGLSLVIAEALACGCPVIATENTGASDLFTNNKEGFIIKPQSSKSITEKLEFFLDNKIKRNEMSYNALSLVRQIGGWDAYGDRWMKKINSLKK